MTIVFEFELGVMMRTAVLVASVGVTACVPMHVQDTSRVIGTVIDANTKGAVSGAHLFCAEHPDHSVQSNNAGAFDIPPNRKWAFVLLGGDYMSQNCTLTAEAEGYRSLQTRVWFGDDTHKELAMERSAK